MSIKKTKYGVCRRASATDRTPLEAPEIRPDAVSCVSFEFLKPRLSDMPSGSARRNPLAMKQHTDEHRHRMNNVIKFQKPKPEKPPRQTPHWQKKALTWAAIVTGLVAAWAYFYLTQQPIAGTP